MSDLLIKNLELPKKDRIQLSVYPNGKVINHSSFTDTTLLSVVLPPHGRLIDADEAKDTMMIEMCGTGCQSRACHVLDSDFYTPTVLEASKE